MNLASGMKRLIRWARPKSHGFLREFVDEASGVVVPPEDPQALADGIARLVEDPELFTRLSAAAAQRVRAQSAVDRVIAAELELLGE